MAFRQKGYKNPRLTGSTGIFNPRTQPKQPAGTPYNRAAPPPSAPMRGGLLREAAKQRARAPGAGGPPIPETKYPIRPQPAPQPSRSTIGAGDEARRAAAARMEGFEPIEYGGQPGGGEQPPPEQFGPQFTPGMGMPDQGPPEPVTEAPTPPVVPGVPGLGPLSPMSGAAPAEDTPGETEDPSDDQAPGGGVPAPPGVPVDPTSTPVGPPGQPGAPYVGPPGTEGLEYVDGYGWITPEDAAKIKGTKETQEYVDGYGWMTKEDAAKIKAAKAGQAYGGDPTVNYPGDGDPTGGDPTKPPPLVPQEDAEGQSENIQEFILELKDIADSGAAREQKLQEQKGVFLEAIDRMIREAALRRMGSAGIIGKGFGGIAGKFAKEMNATAIEDKRLEVEAMANAINAYVTLHGNELDGETKAALLEAQDIADKYSQFHAEMNNILADVKDLDGFSGGGYTKIYTMFEKYVMGGVLKGDGTPWTTADLLDEFYVKRDMKMWWNGLEPDGTYDPELKGVKSQLSGSSGTVQRNVLWMMMDQVKDSNPEYYDILKAYRDGIPSGDAPIASEEEEEDTPPGIFP
jgi:hypothetical protein